MSHWFDFPQSGSAVFAERARSAPAGWVRWAGVLVLSVTAMGCNAPLKPPAVAHETVRQGSLEAQEPGAPNPVAHGDCPMDVPGTRVTLVPIADGEAMVFTSATEPSTALVGPVFLFASQYDSEQRLDTGPDAFARQPSPLPFATQVGLAQTEAGVRLEIQTFDPRRVEQLKDHLRDRVAAMAETNSCTLSPGRLCLTC